MTVFFTRPVIICLSLLIDLNGFDKESNMIMQRVFCKMPGIILLTLIAGIATATEYTWTGGGGADTNWTTSANWAVPGIRMYQAISPLSRRLIPLRWTPVWRLDVFIWTVRLPEP